MMSVAKHWNRFPVEVLDTFLNTFLNTFKDRLDWALSNLIKLKVSLFTARSLD